MNPATKYGVYKVWCLAVLASLGAGFSFGLRVHSYSPEAELQIPGLHPLDSDF